MAKIFNIGIVGFGKRSKDGLCKSMRNYGAVEGNDGFRVVAVADIRPEEELRAGLEEIGFGYANSVSRFTLSLSTYTSRPRIRFAS